VSKPPAKGKMPEWEPCTEEEMDKMVVQPNWLESMFCIENFHGNSILTYSSEVLWVYSYLNGQPQPVSYL
jgi:hypothetical protein